METKGSHCLQNEKKGFSLSAVSADDLFDYLNVKKSCYKKYVDEYYGGWIEDFQLNVNTNIFEKARKQSCFQKITLGGKTVGFFGYNELENQINGVTIQLIEKAQNKGVGSYYLKQLVSLSTKANKPAYLKVFKSNPAQNLYMRFGFVIYDETPSHFLMRYNSIT